MTSFHHILVPVDFGEANRAALDVAQRMATDYAARVTLLHVIETIDYETDEELNEFYDTLQARARKKLAEVAESFQANNLQVDQQLVLGKRARGIVAFAVEHDVDLVVMSSHTVDAESGKSGLGTISHQVSIFCPCAVLLVK